MLCSRVKDIKNRKLFYRFEQNKILYKFLLANIAGKVLKVKQKRACQYKILKQYNRADFGKLPRILPKCLLTNRNSKTFSSFKLSRIKLKDLVSFGAVPGYTKSIW